MKNFFAIAVNTFKEAIREPIFCVLLLCSVVMIAHFPTLALFVFNDQIKMVLDSSMATTTFIGLLTAVLCASHTVSQEMRNGTVLLLMSKPVARASFVLGKIAGITVACLLFVWICNAATWISLYVAVDQFRLNFALYFTFVSLIAFAALLGLAANYWRNSSFAAVVTGALALVTTAMGLWCLIFGTPDPTLLMGDVLLVLALLFFAVAAMAVLAVIFALRFDMVANLCICSVIFFIGLVSGHLFRPDSDSELINLICGTMYAILPNWQFFWLADALAGRQAVPVSYVGWAAVYVVLYIVLACMWAVAFFQTQEVAKDTRN